MRTTLTFILVSFWCANSFSAQARENEIGKYFERTVIPHFEAYRDCGISHFEALGRQDQTPFADVEVTVADACGQHISAARQAMTAGGLRSRNDQNSVIREMYSVIEPQFRAALERGRTKELETEAMRALQSEWQSCVLTFSGKAALSGREASEIIVRAAFAYYQKQEDDLFQHMTKDGGFVAEFVATDLFPAIKQNLEDRALAIVLTLRAAPPSEKDEPEAQAAPI